MRPSRPRPAPWWSAASTYPSGSPARARAATSALVEPVEATTSTTRQTASGPSVRARATAARRSGGRVRSVHGFIVTVWPRCPATRLGVWLRRYRRARGPAPRAAPTSTPRRASSPTSSARLDEAVHAGSARAVEKQHAKGKQDRPRADRGAARRGLVRRARRAGPAPLARPSAWRRTGRTATAWSPATAPSTAARCACSPRTSRSSAARSGEVYGEKITKVMDLAMKTGCPIIGINECAGARIQEGVVSLGLYGEIFRRNVHASRRDPADQPDHGLLRRRRRLLPRGHRLHGHGRRDLEHVHHRPRRHQDRHRRGRHDGGARRRPHPQHQVGQRPLHGHRRGGRASSTSRRCSPTCRRTTSTTRPVVRRGRPTSRSRDVDRDARHADPRLRRTSPTTCTR